MQRDNFLSQLKLLRDGSVAHLQNFFHCGVMTDMCRKARFLSYCKEILCLQQRVRL